MVCSLVPSNAMVDCHDQVIPVVAGVAAVWMI